MTAAPRFLIVNADDFGTSTGLNAGIMRAHAEGIVTSASLMVRRPRAREASELAREEGIGLGLHVDLAEWEPRAGVLTEIYRRVDLEDSGAVAAEIDQQVELFVDLVGRPPDHLDSHQHVHQNGAARDASIRVAERLGVPLRRLRGGVTLCDGFYGQQENFEPYPEGTSLENLLRQLDTVRDGWTELMCHPGLAYDIASVYKAEREAELETLCRPEVRAALDDRCIELRNFSQLPH